MLTPNVQLTYSVRFFFFQLFYNLIFSQLFSPFCSHRIVEIHKSVKLNEKEVNRDFLDSFRPIRSKDGETRKEKDGATRRTFLGTRSATWPKFLKGVAFDSVFQSGKSCWKLASGRQMEVFKWVGLLQVLRSLDLKVVVYTECDWEFWFLSLISHVSGKVGGR